MAEELTMEQILPVRTVTYEENCQARIDFVVTTPGLIAGLIKCGVGQKFDSNSDHLPILTGAESDQVNAYQTQKFQQNRPQTFREALAREMATKEDPRRSYRAGTIKSINQIIK